MTHTAREPRGAELPAFRQPSRELLMAWLLLLLQRDAGHGYDLQRQLEVQGVVTESGAMYRTLRRLESDGFAESSWANSIAGPRRRLYRVTSAGRLELEKLVGAITVKRDVHAAFLNAHDDAPQ